MSATTTKKKVTNQHQKSSWIPTRHWLVFSLVQLLSLLFFAGNHEGRKSCLLPSLSPPGTPELFPGSLQHNTWQPHRAGPCSGGQPQSSTNATAGCSGKRLQGELRAKPKKADKAFLPFQAELSRWKRVLPQLISRFLSSSLLCSFIFQRHHVPLHSKSTFQGTNCWITSGDAV